MQILSDTIIMPKSELENMQTVLSEKFGTVLRWAIVDIHDDKIKVCFAYATISA